MTSISPEAAAFIAEREAWWARNPPAPKNLTVDNIGKLEVANGRDRSHL